MKSSALDFLEYPCDYPLKIVGKHSDSLESMVLELVKQHLDESHAVHSKQNPSKKKNYLSITITFQAQSREQLETIYQCLYDSPHVLMTL